MHGNSDNSFDLYQTKWGVFIILLRCMFSFCASLQCNIDLKGKILTGSQSLWLAIVSNAKLIYMYKILSGESEWLARLQLAGPDAEAETMDWFSNSRSPNHHSVQDDLLLFAFSAAGSGLHKMACLIFFIYSFRLNGRISEHPPALSRWCCA